MEQQQVFTLGCRYGGESMVENYIVEIWWKNNNTLVQHFIKPLQYLPESHIHKDAKERKQVMKELHEALQGVKHIQIDIWSLPGIEYYFDLTQLPNLRTRRNIKITII
jgi:hypothetical protein